MPPSSVNYIIDSQDISAFAIMQGTPVITGGQADPFGGTNAFLIEDDSGSVVELVSSGDLEFPTDGTKILSVWFKEAPSPPADTRIQLRDTTMPAFRSVLIVTWTGGVPTVVANVGSLIGGLEDWGNSWFRQWITAPDVVAANTNLFRIAPAGANAGATGEVLVFGAMVTDGVLPVPYEATFGVAKTTVHRGRGVRPIRAFAGEQACFVPSVYEVTAIQQEVGHGA